MALSRLYPARRSVPLLVQSLSARLLACAAFVCAVAGPAVADSGADTAVAASAPAATSVTASSSDAPRYLFAAPIDGAAAGPRGGTTTGAPVMLDRSPSDEWKALQQPGLDAPERDRRAIVAMAGTYRVSFDFLEVDTFVAPPKPLAPYQSWSTEKVYVDTDRPGFISLVHILEMRVVDARGVVSDPIVMKHWRQDWTYEPASVVEYKGNDRWQSRTLGDAERRGAWLQTVYQVDESPRYAGVGRWQHTGTFSSWISGDTWRPLPRREWGVRSDYQVLLGTNRHTIRPTGWTQEENNLKTVLTAQRDIDPARPYLAREYGVARYERLRDTDFAAADHYYESTRVFWDRVRDSWSAAFAQQGGITLKGPVDKLGLFAPLFERADYIEEHGPYANEEDASFIRGALGNMGVYR